MRDRFRRASQLLGVLALLPLIAASQEFRRPLALRAPIAFHRSERLDAGARRWSDGRPDHPGQVSVTLPQTLPRPGVSSPVAHPSLPSRITLTDVQIGTLDSVQKVTLAYDPGSGTLFSVLLYTGDSSVSGIAMYFSSDTGSTWIQTAGIVSSSPIPDVSLTNSAGYFVVAGIYDSGRQVLMDRFFVNDGSPLDTSFLNPQVAFRAKGEERFTEVATSSNLYTFNNRVYCAALSDDRHVRFVAARDTGASDLFEYGSGEFAGSRGISTTYNNSPSHRSFAYIAFIDSTQTLCIDALPDTNIGQGSVARVWRDEGRSSVPHADGTSLTALNDTILVGYSPTVNGLTRAMLASAVDVGNGTSWSADYLGDSLAGSDVPVVTMESGNGLGVIYRYASSPAQLRFALRPSAASPWNVPITVSAIEPFFAPGALADLGGGVYGFVSLSSLSPVIQGAYFSTNVLTTVGVPQAPPFASTFGLSQNYPNPFNPKTVIRGQWTVDSRVRLVVYDLLGREVAVLADGRYPAGEHTFTFDGTTLASGVYFYRLTAGSFTATKAMILTK